MELDDLDRQIAAALIRNGRAPWRQIADVLDQQERTVARRGNRLLESGLVRINAFANPTAWDEAWPFLVRAKARPEALRSIARWLAERPNVSWATAMASPSECVAEVWLHPKAKGAFLYRELASMAGLEDASLIPIFQYHRTVSGWQPPLLDAEQYLALHRSEDELLAARGSTAKPDESNRALISLLQQNGRATVEELAASLSLSTATVSRRLEALTSTGALYVRAVLDPATIGYPVEALIELECPTASDSVGRAVAALPSSRWVAADGKGIVVQSAVGSLGELQALLLQLHTTDGVEKATYSLYAEIFKRSSVIYHDGLMQ